jgi:K+-sensing histidine kinase KdpD
MADHGTIEYATAPGNDMPAHEATYTSFIHFALVGTIHVICLCLALAIGGVMGHWFIALPVFFLAVVGCIPALMTSSATPSYVAFVLSFLIFVYATTLPVVH